MAINFTSTVQDLLNEGLDVNNHRVIVEKVWDINFASSRPYSTRGSTDRSKTPGNAKSLLEFYTLVGQVVNDMETRAGTPADHRVIFTEEEPDVKSQTETITYSLMKRTPGAYGGGAPFESRVHNLVPMHREEGNDKENPGYRYVIKGYWYDNLVRFTCWARTNKAANARAAWFEELMQEYSWWYALQGVNRVLFWDRGSDIVTKVDGNKWYGRPIDFFVRTEKLKVFSERELEEISVRLSVTTE